MVAGGNKYHEIPTNKITPGSICLRIFDFYPFLVPLLLGLSIDTNDQQMGGGLWRRSKLPVLSPFYSRRQQHYYNFTNATTRGQFSIVEQLQYNGNW